MRSSRRVHFLSFSLSLTYHKGEAMAHNSLLLPTASVLLSQADLKTAWVGVRRPEGGGKGQARSKGDSRRTIQSGRPKQPTRGQNQTLDSEKRHRRTSLSQGPCASQENSKESLPLHLPFSSSLKLGWRNGSRGYLPSKYEALILTPSTTKAKKKKKKSSSSIKCRGFWVLVAHTCNPTT
jgi:hypothetical protein